MPMQVVLTLLLMKLEEKKSLKIRHVSGAAR